MTKQSYAHLDLGYWIEVTQLQRWGNNSRRLFEDSFLAIRQAYYEAEAWRQVHGSESARRLSASSKRSRSASPEPQAMQAPAYQVSSPSGMRQRGF